MTRPDDGDAHVLERLLGLATFCMRAGDLPRAHRVLDLSEACGLDPLRVALARARLALLDDSAAEAEGHLRTARDIDPFDEDAADLLGRVLEAGGEHDEALDCFVDAQIVAGTVDPDRVASYDEPIARLVAAAGLDDAALRDRRAQRTARLEELAFEAEEHAERPEPVAETDPGPDGGEHPPMREVLRDVAPFGSLGDAELRLLECAVERVRVRKGKAVFREGQPSVDLFVVEAGIVTIERQTPFGVQVLATVGADGLFGEMNFMDGLSRSADAVAAEDAILLRISHEALREIFAVDPGLALTFMEQFWRGLSDKIREANELMKTFFTESDRKPGVTPKKAQIADGARAELAAGKKTDVLRAKGLTAGELDRVADFAAARRFESEAVIFREGDAGRSLYVVLEGSVRIEKHIPGIGQEALAVLEPGDFFGEMAIIDEGPRSASAIAHAAETTVLVIEKAELDALLAARGEGAHELLQILCRLLSARLREINDKIVQWRFMSGGF